MCRKFYHERLCIELLLILSLNFIIRVYDILLWCIENSCVFIQKTLICTNDTGGIKSGTDAPRN